MRLLRDLRACFQRDSESRVLARNLSRCVIQAWQQVDFENGGQAVLEREQCHSTGEVWPPKSRETDSNTNYGLAGNGIAMERPAGSRARVGPVRLGPKIPEYFRRKTAYLANRR
jgi:hypothetical protein